MSLKYTLLSDWVVLEGVGRSSSVDVVVVSGGEITLSVVVRFGISCLLPPMKMLKS